MDLTVIALAFTVGLIAGTFWPTFWILAVFFAIGFTMRVYAASEMLERMKSREGN